MIQTPYKIVSLLLFLTIISGCWDINESDRMDYVYSIGVDYEDSNVIVHLQLVNLSSLGTPEITSEDESRAVIATASANTISEAVHEIYQSAQQRLYLGHNTSIILTEAALKNGKLKEAIDLANRFPETQYRMNVFATKDNIPDLFEVTTIFQGSPILTRVTDLENIYEQSSRIKNLSLRELIIHLDEPNYEAKIPVIAAEKNVWKTEDEDLIMMKDIGVALVTSNDVKGFLINDDIKGLRWTVKSDRNNVTIYEDDNPVGELIVVRPKQKYTIHEQGDKVQFELSINARAMINEIMQDISEKKIIKLIEQQIKEEVMRTYTEALKYDADIYQLSEKVYRRKLKTWQKLNIDGTIPLTEDSLTVKVNIDLVDSSIDKMEPTVE